MLIILLLPIYKDNYLDFIYFIYIFVVIRPYLLIKKIFAMKNILFIICLFALTEGVAQIPEFSLPLWVKDSKGNKDTVYVGYDYKAKYPLWDGDFGEKDIRDEPFVKDLDVRLGAIQICFFE
jgi:hypothetical protein